MRRLTQKIQLVTEGKVTAKDICSYMTSVQSRGSEFDVQSTGEVVEV